MNAKGAVACGHPATAAAAAEVLEEGGTAFDAVVAAMAAACVAEPVLASLAGGGFLLARPAEGGARLYDFFVDTPLKRRDPGEIDFYPVLADFGTATQEFHIGLGAMATPGATAGLFKIQEDLCRLPTKRLFAPAIRIAREGFTVREMDNFLYRVVAPIFLAHAETRASFADPEDAARPVAVGHRLCQPRLAETLEALAEEGADLFYRGDYARRLCRLSREAGGQIGEADLEAYRVAVREPLVAQYRGARILTNPPPSAGGILIAFALNLLSEVEIAALDPLQAVTALARAMALTNIARVEAASLDSAETPLLDPTLLERYREELLGRPFSPRGTTHISVVDAAGNLAAMTLSNGEGCGRFLPDTGIILNNMLGEEDLNPGGFHRWPAGRRLASMMAPSLLYRPDGSLAALGSGGSNRIRSAVLQALLLLVDRNLPVDQVVEAPRLHVEGNLANFEAGFPKGSEEALAGLFATVKCWPERNLFFGGLHAVTRDADGRLDASGDSRRGGATAIV